MRTVTPPGNELCTRITVSTTTAKAICGGGGREVEVTVRKVGRRASTTNRLEKSKCGPKAGALPEPGVDDGIGGVWAENWVRELGLTKRRSHLPHRRETKGHNSARRGKAEVRDSAMLVPAAGPSKPSPVHATLAGGSLTH